MTALSAWPVAWTAVGTVALAVLAALAPGPIEPWLLLWVLVAVHVNLRLELAVQVGLTVLAATALALLLVTEGRGPADLVLHVGTFLIVSGLVDVIARRERRYARVEREARQAAAEGNQLLLALARMNELDPQRVGQVAVAALDELGFEIAVLWIVDEADGRLRAIATRGTDDAAGLDRTSELGGGFAPHVLRQRRTIVVPEERQSQVGMPPWGQSAVGVPVIVEGTPHGVLMGARRTADAPTPDVVELVEVVGAHAARVLRTAQLYADERRSAAQMAELDRLKSDFVSSVSHELRTPMTVIQGLGETLRMHHRELGPAARADLLARMRRHAARLDDLIASLLQLSRLEAGAVDLHLEQVRLDEMIAAAARGVEPMLRGHQLELHVTDHVVRADRERIVQVVQQLLSNAVIHTPQGTRVEVATTVEQGTAVVSVSDEGPGIPAEELPFVTERFFRGGTTDGRSSSGLGLGLTVADRLLRAHGSRLEVAARAAGGATFRFRLPIVA